MWLFIVIWPSCEHWGPLLGFLSCYMVSEGGHWVHPRERLSMSIFGTLLRGRFVFHSPLLVHHFLISVRIHESLLLLSSTLLCCSGWPSSGDWELFYGGLLCLFWCLSIVVSFCLLLLVCWFCLNNVLFSGTLRCFRLILSISCQAWHRPFF